MHGVIRSSSEGSLEKSLVGRTVDALRPYRWFLLFVILPTLLGAAYYWGVASDQYESDADFVVRRSETAVKGSAGIGQILGLSIGSSQSQAEAYLVEEYLLSHDVVASLRQDDRLVERFSRHDIDLFSRLWYANPTPETLLKYYHKHVDVGQDPESGITHLRVRAFSPDDAYALSRKLLVLGEQRVNQINERNFRDEIASSQRQMAEAQAALNVAQEHLTAFRSTHGDIDPVSSGRAQIGLVTSVSTPLVAARAQLENLGRTISRSSPQYQAMRRQVETMEAQVAHEGERLAGGGKSIATNLGDYEDLMVQKEFATQRYTASAAAFEQAKADALKQQIYVTRIVEPNVPVKSLFPERGKAVATIFFSLLLAYAIGWLLVSGVKEHSI